MKRAVVRSRELKKLFNSVKKEGGKVSLTTDEDPLRLLLLGILGNYASEQRALAALNKLLAAFVDVNELRVTSVAEMIEIIGKDFPKVRPASEEIAQVLNSIFNRRHDLDLSFLKTNVRKPAETFLNSLDSLSPHAKAFFIQRHVRNHIVPLDEHMFACLIKAKAISEDATVEDAQKLLTGQIKERDGLNFYGMFKRFAAVHGPRKLPEKRAPEPAPVVQEAPRPAASKPAATSKPTTTNKSAAANKPAAAAKPAAAKPKSRTSAASSAGASSKSRKSASSARR